MDPLKLAYDMTMAAAERELDCDECLGQLAAFAEAVQAGAADAALWREIRIHMEVCACCRAELEGLLRALEEFSAGEG